ncbi:MAG TPA: hypothetical protein VH639_05505 [Bryobacteraceae bacterium]|jgi:type IV secretion system protein VirB10
MRKLSAVAKLLLASILLPALPAADVDRDFSGKWILDQTASHTQGLGAVEASLAVTQDASGILYSTPTAQWSYTLDGSETRKTNNGESRNSVTKWEGSALLVNTLVSGARTYTIMDRWALSRDRNTLNITRHIVRTSGEAEGTLVFRREGAVISSARPDASENGTVVARRSPALGQTAPQPVLAKRPEPGLGPDVTVPIGTHVLLELIGEVSTKHAREGDRVYLRTSAPVAANGRVVIPRGSDVSGSITRTKPAGRVAGKGELYIRFDSLILPNGVSRDFHARPTGDEGKVEGDGRAADGRTVMTGAGMGATIGAITRGLPGAAVGGAGGALAGVLLSRNQDVVLRPGTHLEMVLDRDLVFHPEELPTR